MDAYTAAKILATKKENARVKTLLFDIKMRAKPGQFIMAWVPGLNEKPFSLSHMQKQKTGITVASVGHFSRYLHTLDKGDRLWLRGPYGNGFEIKGRRIVIVGGGYGMAPLAPLAEEALGKGVKTEAIIGARSKNDLLFVDRIKRAGIKPLITTADGSAGIKGFVTDALASLFKLERIDCVYGCGPEVMLKKIFEMCEEAGAEAQLSLERYMKCGLGLCGQCALDGLRVCTDGPVFNSAALRKIRDFGRFRLDPCGRRTEI